MNLDEFIAERYAHLEQFVAWWKDQQESHPEGFPEEMEPGAWDEQLDMFDYSSDGSPDAS